MTVREAAAELRLHPVTIYRLIEAGKIRAIEIQEIKRNRFRIPVSEVERLKGGGG